MYIIYIIYNKENIYIYIHSLLNIETQSKFCSRKIMRESPGAEFITRYFQAPFKASYLLLTYSQKKSQSSFSKLKNVPFVRYLYLSSSHLKRVLLFCKSKCTLVCAFIYLYHIYLANIYMMPLAQLIHVFTNAYKNC